MTSTSQLSEEEINFTRFFLLNFKVSPDIVRRYFDGVFPPAHLSQTINNGMKTIIQLNKSKIINSAQFEILRSVLGTVWPSNLPPMPVGTKSTCSKDFDLTMMICLLRNLGGLAIPINGWDKLPHPNDTVHGADLATLKWHRNDLAHATVTYMDSNEFIDKWTQVEKALTSLNKGQRPYEVIEILRYDLDGEQANLLDNAELNELKKEYLDCEKEKEQIESDFSFYRDGNLPKNIADMNTDLVEAWIKDDESFVETQGSKLVDVKINECNCLVVTSNSGLGKTATIRHIALKLKHKEFQIVPVESLEDIIKYKTNKKQLFLIDDVLGKYDLSPTRLDEWESKNEKIISCLNIGGGSKKIMCTLRLQIARNKRFKNASTILNKTVINLQHESCVLSNEEKKNILMKHLRRNNLENKITTEEVAIMCKKDYAFPLLCKLVSNNEERFRKKLAFFRQPISLLKKELNKISNENKSLYCMLVLCILFNGSFRRKMFDIDSNEGDEKIYKIMHTCGLQRSISKKELEDSALSALGSYFKTDGFNFQFIHDALEETVGIHFCTLYPEEMFAHCNIAFIRDRVRMHSNESITANVDENFVYIREDELNDDHLKPLYTRLWAELKLERFSTLLASHLFRNKNFVCALGTFLKNNKGKLKSSKLPNFDNERHISSIKNILQNQFQINTDAICRVIEVKKWNNQTLMYWIVAFGCNEFFQYAWSAMTPSEQKSLLSQTYSLRFVPKPLFPLAVLGGSVDIVKELILTGADVNCFSEFWETPLYIAVTLDNYDMARVLLRNGALVNLRGWFDMKIPILVTSNNHQFTSLILKYDLNQTKLHKAVRQNDLHILRSNISSKIIDRKTKSGWSVLHYAVLLNNLGAVKVLFNDESPHNDGYSVEYTQDDQREVLCRKPTPRVNEGDNNGLTAVHLAVINNNIEILSILLRNKAEVKVRDDFDKTPLHYTTSKRATKLLLNHSSKTQCLATNRNVNEMREYDKAPLSVSKTTLFNVTLKSGFRNVCRDYINMPDSAGNTPLHSVLNSCLLKEERSDCIETLLENGANPYLLNDMSISALQIIDSCCETDKYIENSAEYKKSLQKTHKVFVFVSLAFTIGLLICSLCIDSKVSTNEVDCFFTESYRIALVQGIRIQYSLILSIVPLWLLILLWFNMRGSTYRFFFNLFVITGFGSFILISACFYHAYTTLINIVLLTSYFILLFWMPLEIIYLLMDLIFMFLKDRKRETIGFILICFGTFCIFSPTFLFGIFHPYIESDIKTLIIYRTDFKCSEYNFVNVSCSHLNHTITYKNGVDFSVRCVAEPKMKMKKYDGALIVESECIDWSIIFMFLMFLHLICASCFIKSIFTYHAYVQNRIMEPFRKKKIETKSPGLEFAVDLSLFKCYVAFLVWLDMFIFAATHGSPNKVNFCS